MGIVMPTENSDAGTWDETLNAAGERIDEHNHTTGKGLPITPDAISINKDLAMGGNSLTGIDSLDFNTLSGAIGSRVRTLYWSGGDLYARNASGQTIRITNGGALDLSLVGGIGGDYTTTDAEVEYDFTNDRYKFLSDASPETYSKVTAAVAQLINGVYAMNVVAPTLAANRTITLPQYAPSGQRLLQIDSSGVITPDNAVDEALTFGSTVGVTGAATFSSTVGITGNLTLTPSDMKHGERTLWMPAVAATELSNLTRNSSTWVVNGAGTASAAAMRYVPLPLEVGQRIKGIRANLERLAGGPDNYTVSLILAGTGSIQSFGVQSASGWEDILMTLTTPRVVAAGESFMIAIEKVNTWFTCRGVAVVYDRV